MTRYRLIEYHESLDSITEYYEVAIFDEEQGITAEWFVGPMAMKKAEEWLKKHGQ